MNNYENAIENLAKNALNAITVTQEYADSIEEPIIMFSLEAAHNTVSTMARIAHGREREFECFIDLIGDSLGANQTHWRDQWDKFSQIGFTIPPWDR